MTQIPTPSAWRGVHTPDRSDKVVMQQALDALLGYKPHSLTHAKEQSSAIIALREAIAQPVQPAAPVAQAEPSNTDSRDAEPPLTGRWHHGNGQLVSGTIRVARWDCDTNPPIEFRDDLLEWMCDTLNSAVSDWNQAEMRRSIAAKAKDATL